MRKTGKYYYKNFWGFIQHKVFRMPSIKMIKSHKITPVNPKLTIENFLYRELHEEWGDR